jgi:hypothetical protein
MIQKIFRLLNIQHIDYEGDLIVLTEMRSLAEQICLDLIAHYQNVEQIGNTSYTNNLLSNLIALVEKYGTYTAHIRP